MRRLPGLPASDDLTLIVNADFARFQYTTPRRIGKMILKPVCVISDTSAVSALARMDWLGWLVQRWGSVILPEEVWFELTRIGDPVAWLRLEEARGLGWLEVTAAPVIKNPEFDHLHLGEVAVLSLALERRADWVVMDDGDARVVARLFGFRIIGVLGLMLWAKRQGLLKEMGAAIAALQVTTGFRVSPNLVSQILSDCGEDSE